MEAKHSEYMCGTCGEAYGAKSLHAVVRDATGHGLPICANCGNRMKIFITLYGEEYGGKLRGKLVAAYRPGFRVREEAQVEDEEPVRHPYLVLLKNRKQGLIAWWVYWTLTRKGKSQKAEMGQWNTLEDEEVINDLLEQAARDGHTFPQQQDLSA
jgi:hypothetical protein